MYTKLYISGAKIKNAANNATSTSFVEGFKVAKTMNLYLGRYQITVIYIMSDEWRCVRMKKHGLQNLSEDGECNSGENMLA